MALGGDYLELDLHLDYYDDDDMKVAVWVHRTDRSMLRFHDVRTNPVRSHGTWEIEYMFLNRPATAVIPAEDITHFTVVRDTPADAS